MNTPEIIALEVFKNIEGLIEDKIQLNLLSFIVFDEPMKFYRHQGLIIGLRKLKDNIRDLKKEYMLKNFEYDNSIDDL